MIIHKDVYEVITEQYYIVSFCLKVSELTIC